MAGDDNSFAYLTVILNDLFNAVYSFYNQSCQEGRR